MDQEKYKGQAQEKLGKKTYIYLDTLPALARKVADQHSLDIGGLNLKFALVSPEINKRAAGQCQLITGQTKLLTDTNYFITFSEIVWDELDDVKKELLMCHELMHIYKKYGDDGEIKKLALAQHDTMDFRYLIKRYGVDWLDYIEDSKQIMDDYQKKLKEEKSKKKEKETNLEEKNE